MPTTVRFTLTSTHTIQPLLTGGLRYVPAIPANARLYVIDNGGPYIGASTDVKERFKARLRVLWEFGMNGAGVQIDIFRISIGGTNTTPDDYGDCHIDVLAGGVWVTTAVDVEHLLIRIYTQQFNINVRNTQKWQNAFDNPFPDALDWSIVIGGAVFANGQIPHNGSL